MGSERKIIFTVESKILKLKGEINFLQVSHEETQKVNVEPQLEM